MYYWFQYLSLGCLVVCISACLWHFFRLVRLGKPKDLSQKSGNVAKSVIYSNTAAMLPNKKESAYLHLPTYTAGIIFHLGSFVSLLLFFVFLFFESILLNCFFSDRWWWVLICITCFLSVTSLCGLFLFFKRLFSKKLRPLSNFDDYFSTGIVTLFQLFTATLLAMFFILLICNFIEDSSNILFSFLKFFDIIHYGYYITASLLFLYLPVGKLRHVVYYFAARYHLGFFYGWRNSWPPKNKNKENRNHILTT